MVAVDSAWAFVDQSERGAQNNQIRTIIKTSLF